MNSPANSNLIYCIACNKEVSKRAKSCPHCGQKNPGKRKGSGEVPKPLVWVLIGLVIIVGINKITHFDPDKAPTHRQSSADTSVARKECESAIRAYVTNPSTLEIHHFSGYGQNVEPDGTIKIVQSFSAKNAFGLKRTYDALCITSPKGKFEILVREQGR